MIGRDIQYNDLFLWNGLPSFIDKTGDVEYTVAFSNVSNKMRIIRVPTLQADSENIRRQLADNGFVGGSAASSNSYFNIILSLTEKCNCRCKYCFLDAESYGLNMTDSVIKTAINYAFDVAGNRAVLVSAFGGEPSVNYPGLKLMVAYANAEAARRRKNVSFSITTNGVFNEKVMDTLLENRFKVSLSMDGIKCVQDYQRPLANGKSSYSYAISSIKTLVDASIDIKVRATVTRYSAPFMPDAVDLMSQLGVKKIQFEPVTKGGRGVTANDGLLPPNADDFSYYLVEAIKRAKSRGVSVHCFAFSNLIDGRHGYCNGCVNDRLVVSPSGVLSTCVEMQTEEHPLYKAFAVGCCSESGGIPTIDLRSQSSAVFEDERMTDARRTEYAQRCAGCALKTFCTDGCPSRNFRGSGSTKYIDPYRCEIIRKTVPYVLYQAYRQTYG